MKNSLKNIENRKNEILIYINQHDFADVDTLTTRFGVSRVTIRKDLDQMAKEGLITRTYGGASKINSPSLITIQNTNNIASSLELTERKIAKAAADMIEENDIVLINSSLTASYVIEYLGNKHVTIVTNNISILTRNRHPNTTLILTGGQVTEGRHAGKGHHLDAPLQKVYHHIGIGTQYHWLAKG